MRKLYFFLIFSLINLSFIMPRNHVEMPENERIVNETICKIAASLQKKYKMQPIGTSISMPDGIVKELGIDFQIIGPLTREELRKILVDCAQELLSVVNTTNELLPFLEKTIFSVDNVDINLFIVDTNGVRLEQPNIGVAGIIRGKLDYEILVTEDIPIVKNSYVETYEDALKFLKI